MWNFRFVNGFGSFTFPSFPDSQKEGKRLNFQLVLWAVMSSFSFPSLWIFSFLASFLKKKLKLYIYNFRCLRFIIGFLSEKWKCMVVCLSSLVSEELKNMVTLLDTPTSIRPMCECKFVSIWVCDYEFCNGWIMYIYILRKLSIQKKQNYVGSTFMSFHLHSIWVNDFSLCMCWSWWFHRYCCIGASNFWAYHQLKYHLLT